MPMIPELPVAMLACARIGAAHSVVFGGFSADALRGRIEDAEAKVLITADGGWRRGQPVALKPNADAALCGGAASIEHVVVVRRLGDAAAGTEMTEGGPVVARAGRPAAGALPARGDGVRGPAVPALHLGHHGQAEGNHAHHGRLPHPGRLHAQVRLRPPPRTRRLLVRRRHRLGDRAQLHRLRPAGERGDQHLVRGHAGPSRSGPVVVDHRALQGVDPLLRADCDPHLHEVGHRASGGGTISRACGSSAPSASPSTQKRGSGTGSRSAVADARWSTPGGRPRPAPS